MAGIFKSYDIRGKYPEEINETLVRKLMAAAVKVLHPKHVLLGHDPRHGSPELYEACADELSKLGVRVVKMGLASRPMLFVVATTHEFDLGVLITASHNPREFNGIKMVGKEGAVISYDHGYQQMEAILDEPPTYAKHPGEISTHDFMDAYTDFLIKQLDVLPKTAIVADPINGTTGPILEALFKKLPGTVHLINAEPDGDFPGHNPNPLKPDATELLSRTVVEQGADVGCVFDPDGDRIVFVDEKGTRINVNHITALLCDHLLKEDQSMTYDLISSRIVPETAEARGAKAYISKVGYTNMHDVAKRHQTLFSAETSSHYAYKATFYHDAGLLTLLYVLQIREQTGRPMSQLIRKYQKYVGSGEINLRVKDPKEGVEQISAAYKDLPQDHLDGVTVNGQGYWFNARPSNTEPLLRIRIEAQDPATIDQVKLKLIDLVGGRPE